MGGRAAEPNALLKSIAVHAGVRTPIFILILDSVLERETLSTPTPSLLKALPFGASLSLSQTPSMLRMDLDVTVLAVSVYCSAFASLSSVPLRMTSEGRTPCMAAVAPATARTEYAGRVFASLRQEPD